MSVGFSSIERATALHADQLCALFARSEVPCFCQYYQFAGDHRDWQMRCAGSSEANLAALKQDLLDESLSAFVAKTESEVVGWMRLARPQNLSKLYQGRLYKGLPCFTGERSTVFAIACFLVDTTSRRSGVASALLQAGIEWAKGQGATAIEAFPRGAQDVTDGEQFTGPLPLYEAAGFVKVHDFAPYPVLRLELS